MIILRVHNYNDALSSLRAPSIAVIGQRKLITSHFSIIHAKMDSRIAERISNTVAHLNLQEEIAQMVTSGSPGEKHIANEFFIIIIFVLIISAVFILRVRPSFKADSCVRYRCCWPNRLLFDIYDRAWWYVWTKPKSDSPSSGHPPHDGWASGIAIFLLIKKRMTYEFFWILIIDVV